MHTVVAVPIAPVRTVPHLDDVLAIFRRDHRSDPILPDQRTVIARRQLEPRAVHHRDIHVEQRHTQPDRFDLSCDPLALFRIDHEVVDIFALHDPMDRHIHRHRLRSRELTVRLDLINHRQRTDKERLELAHARRRPHPEPMAPEHRVGCNLERRLHVLRIDNFQLRDFDSWFVEQDLLGILQPGTGQRHHHLGPALPTPGRQAPQARRRRLGQTCRPESQTQFQADKHSDRRGQSGRAIHVSQLQAGTASSHTDRPGFPGLRCGDRGGQDRLEPLSLKTAIQDRGSRQGHRSIYTRISRRLLALCHSAHISTARRSRPAGRPDFSVSTKATLQSPFRTSDRERASPSPGFAGLSRPAPIRPAALFAPHHHR